MNNMLMESSPNFGKSPARLVCQFDEHNWLTLPSLVFLKLRNRTCGKSAKKTHQKETWTTKNNEKKHEHLLEKFKENT